MAKNRISHSQDFKAKVALEALWEHKTLAELNHEYKLHSTQISAWKSVLRKGASLVFDKQSLLKERKDYAAQEQEFVYSYRSVANGSRVDKKS